MYCRDCGYCLKGLQDNRCPECGLRFAPGDSKTFLADTEAAGPRLLLMALTGFLLLAISLAFAHVFGRTRQPGQINLWGALYLLFLAAFYVFELGVFIASSAALLKNRYARHQRTALIVACVISSIIAICCPVGMIAMAVMNMLPLD
jgi:hypothetical protein